MGAIICHLLGGNNMSLMGVRLYVTHGVHSHVTYWGTLICHSLKDKGLSYLFYQKYPKKFGTFLTNHYFCKKH